MTKENFSKTHTGKRREYRKNGDVYVFERVTAYDPKKKQTVTVKEKLLCLNGLVQHPVLIVIVLSSFSTGDAEKISDPGSAERFLVTGRKGCVIQLLLIGAAIPETHSMKAPRRGAAVLGKIETVCNSVILLSDQISNWSANDLFFAKNAFVFSFFRVRVCQRAFFAPLTPGEKHYGTDRYPLPKCTFELKFRYSMVS